MTRDELVNALETMNGCEKALKWVRNAPGDPAEIWQSSECAGQLLRLAIYAGVDRRSVSLALCDCVRIVLPFANSDTPRHTIEIIEKWSRGAATAEQVLAAAEAAEAAAEAAVADAYVAAASADAAATVATVAAVATAAYEASAAAAAVADAAADAAYAAATVAYEASAVYTVAYVVVAAVAVDSAARNRAEMERRCADLIRARIPWATVEAALIRARKEDRPR